MNLRDANTISANTTSDKGLLVRQTYPYAPITIEGCYRSLSFSFWILMTSAAPAMTLSSPHQAIAQAVCDAAERAGVFGAKGTAGRTTADNGLILAEFAAANSTEPSFYRVEAHGENLYVALVMADRWQSHSIEADLLNTGDHLEDLVAEELVELNYREQVRGESKVPCEHFRSEDKLFTFRSKLPAKVSDPRSQQVASVWFLAYEAAFRPLGDMDAGEEGGHH